MTNSNNAEAAIDDSVKNIAKRFHADNSAEGNAAAAHDQWVKELQHYSETNPSPTAAKEFLAASSKKLQEQGLLTSLELAGTRQVMEGGPPDKQGNKKVISSETLTSNLDSNFVAAMTGQNNQIDKFHMMIYEQNAADVKASLTSKGKDVITDKDLGELVINEKGKHRAQG